MIVSITGKVPIIGKVMRPSKTGVKLNNSIYLISANVLIPEFQSYGNRGVTCWHGVKNFLSNARLHVI